MRAAGFLRLGVMLKIDRPAGRVDGADGFESGAHFALRLDPAPQRGARWRWPASPPGDADARFFPS
jgi:hypothetical protein